MLTSGWFNVATEPRSRFVPLEWNTAAPARHTIAVTTTNPVARRNVLRVERVIGPHSPRRSDCHLRAPRSKLIATDECLRRRAKSPKPGYPPTYFRETVQVPRTRSQGR